MAEAQKPKNMYWNQVSKRWELKGKGIGSPALWANDGGIGVPGLTLGAGRVSLIQKITGTIPLTNVGTVASVTATLTGMTGVAIGDIVIPTVKSTGLVAGVSLDGAWVPTTNVVNIKLNNVSLSTGGSQSALGVDVLVIRLA